MIRLVLTSIILSTLLLLSCGDDDGSVAGTYKIILISSSQCDDPELNFDFDFADSDCITELGIEVCLDGTMTLTDNGSFSATFTISVLGFSETSTENGTYTVDGNAITVCDNNNDCDTGTIRSGGNEITLSFPPDSDNCVTTITGRKV